MAWRGFFRYAVMPTTAETVLSQLGHQVFGDGFLYYALQYSTFAILVLAANTAFADFPRLANILATDKFMPSQLAARGDRLAFSNGIITLALIAMLLVWLFNGDTNALIPLYAIGVFVCFTLSQAGMVMHWLRSKEQGWRWRAALNGVGAFATGVVSVIQIVTKFAAGAWIVALIIPIFILLLQSIQTHYRRFAIDIAFRGRSPILPHDHTVVVPIGAVNKATAAALVYATSLSRNVRAVHIEVDLPRTTPKLEREWDRWDIGYQLEVLSSTLPKHRALLLVDFVLLLQEETLLRRADHGGHASSSCRATGVEYLLHNRTALYIRTAFLFKPNVVVVAVPYLVGHDYEHEERGPRWTAEASVITGELSSAQATRRTGARRSDAQPSACSRR